ncbi:MAG: hypothetical protein IKC71_00020 [Clostridia bacterium]|nr:hypothetical protein [Clostridia bacterium]
MKKRILAFVAMIAVLATAMSICVSSLSVSAKVVSYDKNFASSMWFDTYAANAPEHLTSTDAYDAFDLTWVPAGANADFNYGATFAPRAWQGVEVRRDKDADGNLIPDEQYLYFYDKGLDSVQPEGSFVGMNYAFWSTPSVISAAATTDKPFEVELVFKKDGAGWENGGAIWVRFGFYGPNVKTATENWEAADWEAAGLVNASLSENPAANYENGWYYHYITTAINSDGSNNEYYVSPDTGWSVLRTQINVPAVYDGANRFSIQLKYSDGATEEIEDLGFKIKRFSISATVDIGLETTEATFDKAAPADVEIGANVKSTDTIEIFTTNGVVEPDGNYFVDEGKIVLKAEFLNTLPEGDNVLDIEINGDTTTAQTITVTVLGKGGCGSVIGATSAVLATTLLAGAVLVFKKKD